MEKPIGKPKRKLPLTAESEITDADMERWMRDNRAEINELIREAQEDIAAGRCAELEPLPVLLREARKYAKSKRARRD